MFSDLWAICSMDLGLQLNVEISCSLGTCLRECPYLIIIKAELEDQFPNAHLAIQSCVR